MGSVEMSLAGYEGAVERRLQAWRDDDFVQRLWDGDYRLWVDEPAAEITDRLGWLGLPEAMTPRLGEFAELASALRGIDDVLLFGMGGSSLAPEVFQRVMGNAKGRPPLTVLDTTHPDAIASVARSIDPSRTFCIVSSKSGGTIETISLFYFFWSLVEGNVEAPGSRFAAITDPGSGLEALARERNFGAVVTAPPDVGGRFSALSPFGLVPAALIGGDVEGLVASGVAMASACAPSGDPAANPGVALGAALGELALGGREKLTFLTSPRLESFPDWVEQLVAESTGKDGLGIVPVVGEPLGEPTSYGADRVFVGVTLEGDSGSVVESFLTGAKAAGHPCLRFHLESPTELGAEMYRWEVATAVASSALHVHPFNQENVQLAKTLAKAAMSGESQNSGERVRQLACDAPGLGAVLEEWAAGGSAGEYLSLQAYLPADPPIARKLRELQGRWRRRTGLAVTSGFGPRFLHSTGQLHKGGANNGLFLQLVNEPDTDLRVPETDYTFGKLIAGQADGDAAALLQTGRRVLRLRLGKSPLEDLDRLLDTIA